MKEDIAAKFQQLLLAHPFREISIQMICKAVPISRQTFYNHFHSKEALVQWMVTTDFMDNAFPLFSYHLKAQGAQSFFTYIKKNRNFYQRILEYDSAFLEQCLVDAYNVSTDHVYKFTKPPARCNHKNDKINPDVYRAYANHAIAAVVLYWIREKMQIPVEKIANELYLMMEFPLGYVRDNYFV